MRLLRFVLALSAAVFLLVPVAAQTLDADLQRAIQKEMTTGDSKAAIAEYQKIVERAGSNRPVAAQALLRMAEAYRKLGDAQERKTYERIVTDFGDQRDVAAQARARLGALTPSSATVTDRTIFRREGDLTFATVSPDGTSMTFLDESSLPTSAALLQLQTGRVTRLMSDPNTANRILFPVVSPDGMQTVFTSAGPPIELKIISNMPGAQSRTLRAADAENRYFQPRAWSSDGRSVLTEFQRKDETWQLAWIAVADGRFQVLRSVDWRRHEGLFGRPTLSSDGRYIAYSALATNPSKPVPTRADSKDTHIYVLASDGSSEVDLTPTSSATNQQPVWTADGSHVLFLSDRSGAVDLWAIGVAGGKRAGEPVLVKQNVGDVRAIGMSTAGNYYYLSIERGVPLISFAVLGARAAIDVGREADILRFSGQSREAGTTRNSS
jgi:hypothetical protein